MRDAVGWVQSVLVLGGSSEIGLATARALAARRARLVVLAGRDRAAMEQARPALEAAGATVAVEDFDALDRAAHPAFVARMFERFGDLDLVLLAFGVLGEQQADERDALRAVTVVETNFVGAVSVALPVAEQLRAQGHGILAVLSSVAAERPRRANFIYGASKAGLDAFAQGLGDALHGSGVDVLVVRPGFVHSKMTAGRPPMPLATTPAAVADAIVRGLERRARVIWVPAPLRMLMGVLRHLPHPVFRRLSG